VYCANVTLTNGSAARFQTRQRPQLVFHEDGSPSYLFTSGSFEGNNPVSAAPALCSCSVLLLCAGADSSSLVRIF